MIFYRGFLNELILQDFFENGIKVPLIHTVCDGMTHGMGLARRDVIPTIYYPLFASHLGIRLIVTEQNANWVPARLWNVEDSRRVLNTIAGICPGFDVNAFNTLTDDQLMEHLTKILSSDIPEHPVASMPLPIHVSHNNRDLVVKLIR